MQCFEVSGAVRPLYGSLGFKGLRDVCLLQNKMAVRVWGPPTLIFRNMIKTFLTLLDSRVVFLMFSQRYEYSSFF